MEFEKTGFRRSPHSTTTPQLFLRGLLWPAVLRDAKPILCVFIWTLTLARIWAESAVVSFSSASYSVGETNGAITVLVSRGGETNTAFAVDYFTTNSTAMAALDYGP